MKPVKQLALIAVAAMTISSISSCAKCYVCAKKEADGEKWKEKVCSTDSEFKDDVDDYIKYREANGAKCRISNEAI